MAGEECRLRAARCRSPAVTEKNLHSNLLIVQLRNLGEFQVTLRLVFSVSHVGAVHPARRRTFKPDTDFNPHPATLIALAGVFFYFSSARGRFLVGTSWVTSRHKALRVICKILGVLQDRNKAAILGKGVRRKQQPEVSSLVVR